MKYNKARLVIQTEDRIKTLQKDLATEEEKRKSEWEGYKKGLIADAKIYLQQLREWKPLILAPRLNQRYTSSSYAGQVTQDVRRLQEFLKHLELAEGDTIDFKNNYDINLLNIIIGGK